MTKYETLYKIILKTLRIVLLIQKSLKKLDYLYDNFPEIHNTINKAIAALIALDDYGEVAEKSKTTYQFLFGAPGAGGEDGCYYDFKKHLEEDKLKTKEKKEIKGKYKFFILGFLANIVMLVINVLIAVFVYKKG